MGIYLATCLRKVYFISGPCQPSDHKLDFRNLVPLFSPYQHIINTRNLTPPERQTKALNPTALNRLNKKKPAEYLGKLESQLLIFFPLNQRRKNYQFPGFKASPKISPPLLRKPKSNSHPPFSTQYLSRFYPLCLSFTHRSRSHEGYICNFIFTT